MTTKPAMTLAKLLHRFSTEEACKQFLVEMRWPHGVACPRCHKMERIYTLKSRPFHWVCKNPECGGRNGYRFSVITKTIFENTNYPLRTWFQVIYLMTQSKKGISALQIHRQMGTGEYRTAWYMCHRIRAAMKDDSFPKLMGEIEVDETYVGGKDKNRHRAKRVSIPGGSSKMAVIGAIARKGNVVAKMIKRADGATLQQFVTETVANNVSLIATDEHLGYRGLKKKGYPHKSVTHSKGEYVRGNVHTANLDSFWSLLKRGIVGTYHKVSKEYLPLYLAEFSFRHNQRHNPFMFDEVVKEC